MFDEFFDHEDPKNDEETIEADFVEDLEENDDEMEEDECCEENAIDCDGQCGGCSHNFRAGDVFKLNIGIYSFVVWVTDQDPIRYTITQPRRWENKIEDNTVFVAGLLGHKDSWIKKLFNIDDALNDIMKGWMWDGKIN